jgi:outer membrane protein OmpA-like peptidoglycan-associated protein
VSYLITKGISPDRLIAKGYGEQKLINKCAEGVNCPEEAHQANRRTEIEILENDPAHRHITAL